MVITHRVQNPEEDQESRIMSIRSVRVGAVGAADKHYFAEQGCLLVEGIYTDEEIECALSSITSALPKEGFESPIWGFSNRITSIGTSFSKSGAEWKLYQKPQLASLIDVLTDWEAMYWYEVTGTLVISWPNQPDGTWPHLDYAGEPISQGEGLIYGMIYLTDVDESGARTKVIPGSHIVVRDHVLRYPDDPRNQQLCGDIEFLGLDEAQPVSANAGDILLFDYLLAHSGGGQQRSEPRPVLRVGFTNGKGNLAGKFTNVPRGVQDTLSPLGISLAGR